MEASETCVGMESVVRYRWLEPFVATASFAVWINVFRILENKGDAKSAVSDILDLRRSTRLLRAGAGYWLGIYVLSWLVPRAEVDYGCDWGKAALDLVVGVAAYDFVFYWLHRTMHRVPRLGAWVHHSTHHSPAATRLRAHHVLEHSVADGSLQVLTNIMVQRTGLLGPRNWLARLLHNVIVTYLLTESHADVDGLGIAACFPRLFKGARRHRLHHHHAGPPYQQFFGYLDDALSPVKPENTTAPTKRGHATD